MTPEEIERLKQNAAAMLAYADGRPVQRRDIDTLQWFDVSPTHFNCAIYEFRPKPTETETVQWSKPEHVPGPHCWLKDNHSESAEFLVVVVDHSGVGVVSPEGGIGVLFRIYWRELESYIHTTDRKTWLPCTVPPEENPQGRTP